MNLTEIIMHSSNTILLIAGVLYSIIMHELGHAWVAWKHGDDTARRAGRLTLNPLPHMDPLGTVILPLVLYFTSGSAFGWARPVPVDPSRLRGRYAELWVSLAGVTLNLIIALLFFSIFAWSLRIPSWGGEVRQQMLASRQLLFSIYQVPVWFSPMVLLHIATLNLMLMVFNLLPLPPLDGFHVLSSLLPSGPSKWLIRNQTTLMVLFLILLFSGILQYIYTPVFNGILRLFLLIFGV